MPELLFFKNYENKFHAYTDTISFHKENKNVKKESGEHKLFNGGVNKQHFFVLNYYRGEKKERKKAKSFLLNCTPHIEFFQEVFFF